MELDIIIQKLCQERGKLDRVIASLKQIQSAAAVKKERGKERRGRTFMDAAERQQVAERMRNYWAARRSSVPPSVNNGE